MTRLRVVSFASLNALKIGNNSQAVISLPLPLMETTPKNLGTALLMAAHEHYGPGHDFGQRYPKKTDAVTEPDVRRVARTHLNQDNGVLTIIRPSF